MPDVAIVDRSVAAAPKDYLLPAGQEILLRAVKASFDGSGAGGSYQPTLELIAPDGTVMWAAPYGLSLAAGVSADVSWFPDVGGGASAGGQALIGCFLERTGPITVADSTNTDIYWQSHSYDTDGMWVGGSDARKITINTAGLYLVVCRVAFSPNATGRRLAIVQSGHFYSSGWPYSIAVAGQQAETEATAATSPTAVGVVSCAVGDFLAAGCYQTSGGSLGTYDGINVSIGVTRLAEHP